MNTNQSSSRVQSIIKRLLDITISVGGLILLSPVLAAIALAIKLDSRGEIIYTHPRVGKGGRAFSLYKFRSMVCDGDDTGYTEYLAQLIESDRDGNGNGLPYRKWNCDSRVTRFGNFLRKYYLDELPQFWNVLKGEMSLVGPRPHVQLEVDHYMQDQTRRLSVKPGLTGLWQVMGKADCSFYELIQLDLDYIDHWSLKLDLQIIFCTIILMLKGGEGFWTREAKEITRKFPTGNYVSSPGVYLFDGTDEKENIRHS